MQDGLVHLIVFTAPWSLPVPARALILKPGLLASWTLGTLPAFRSRVLPILPVPLMPPRTAWTTLVELAILVIQQVARQVWQLEIVFEFV